MTLNNYPVDLAISGTREDSAFAELQSDITRLPVTELVTLYEQFNVNLGDSELAEAWFDSDTLPEHIRIRTEAEILEDF